MELSELVPRKIIDQADGIYAYDMIVNQLSGHLYFPLDSDNVYSSKEIKGTISEVISMLKDISKKDSVSILMYENRCGVEFPINESKKDTKVYKS